jgi:uncharacterized membrane protein YcjF (UPF0283 family)
VTGTEGDLAVAVAVGVVVIAVLGLVVSAIRTVLTRLHDRRDARARMKALASAREPKRRRRVAADQAWQAVYLDEAWEEVRSWMM